MKMNSKSEKDTIRIAEQLALRLRGGEVILLYGDLGAGKTVFVKGLARALRVKETVKSPTFNIMKCYTIKHPKTYNLKPKTCLCHIDAYRLKNFKDLLDIGAEEYIGSKNVITVIEWAERIDKFYDDHDNDDDKKRRKIIKIEIGHGEKKNERLIEIRN